MSNPTFAMGSAHRLTDGNKLPRKNQDTKQKNTKTENKNKRVMRATYLAITPCWFQNFYIVSFKDKNNNINWVLSLGCPVYDRRGSGLE
jgi:hypothetical protein